MLTITTGRVQEMSLIREAGKIYPFDITAKSGDKVFAPSWALILAYKNQRIDWSNYDRAYRKLMAESIDMNRSRWEEVVRSFDGCTLVLCCYCPPPPARCHRHILAEMLRDFAEDIGVEAEVVAESV